MERGSENVIPFWCGRTFRYPHEVVLNAQLGPAEKRAILATWASDVNAVDSWPALRHLPGTPFPVTFSSIMDALSQLDRTAGSDDDGPKPTPRARRFPKVPLSLKEAA